ncbi:hypothetical protein PV726_31370 [Streptomyces europaeiscabiei]|uniref:hypothetical protein n=1 Tax=Streptomyces europaeiscabiei TaxID=146819 RepID=UPI0029ADD32F|nr:hypothetical protein [Streptomyces europaeiscabiei]MDX3694755.1 hypothetical protein [Streptomyces europaeiscabiei]
MTLLPLLMPAKITLPSVGELTMKVTALMQGRVQYSVCGPHVRGTFVVVPDVMTDGTVLPSTVTVQYGQGDGPVGDYYSTPRPDEPLVYNVRVHGWTGLINPDDPPSGYFLGRYATGLRDNGIRRELTFGVRRRTEEVVRGVLGHWASLPHREELLRTAARPTAAELAEHEAELAAGQESEVKRLQEERRQARHRINVLNGILRRRLPSLREADRAPARVPLVGGKNAALGVLTVREIAVSEVIPGSVVYEVSGPRVRGRVTVSRHHFRPLPLPQGLRVTYGHVRTKSPFTHEHDDEPSVNGVVVGGIWDLETDSGITPTAPADLPAHARTGVRARMSASPPTSRRASAILRAVALRYLARPDVEGLRLAAAKDTAPGLLTQTRETLRELRAAQAGAEKAAARHRARERQYWQLAGTHLAGLPAVPGQFKGAA